MIKFHINGSTVSSDCSVDMSFHHSSHEDVNITLGVQEVLTALDDILSDADMVKEEDFQKLLNIAGQIQSIAVLRDAEKMCADCRDPYSCTQCGNFVKICDSY